MDPELQAELERLMGNAGAGADALARLTGSIQSGLPNWNAANGSVRGFGLGVQEAEKKVKSAFDKFKSGLGSSYNEIKNGFKSIGSESESGAKAIKNITDSLGNAISGFASQFGMIGGVLGGAATAITGMAGVALGFVDELSTTNKKLNESGIMLGKSFGSAGAGIDEFDFIIKQSGLSAGMLTTVIDNSSESLRLFSGGITSGLRTVTAGFNKLKTANNGQYESLVKLGYSTEEIMEGLADFGATARLAGNDLNMDQLVDGTSEYLKMQRELTRITGTSVKDAKAKADALNREAAFQSYLQGLEPAAANAVKEMLSALPESQQEIAKAAMMGYQILDPALAYVQAQVPDFVQKFKDIDAMAKSGALSMENVSKVTADAQIVADKEFTRARDAVGNSQMLGQYAQAGGRIGEIVAILGTSIFDAKRNAEAAKNTADTTEAVATGMGNIAKSLPEIEKASIALRSALYTVGSTLTAVFAPLITGLAGSVQGGADAIQKSLSALSEATNKQAEIMNAPIGRGPHFDYASEKERQDAASKVVAETIAGVGKIGDGTMFEGLFEQLGDTISAAINNGFRDAVAEINPLSLSKKEQQIENTESLQQLKDALKNLQTGQDVAYAGTDIEARLKKYLYQFDEAERVTKAKEIGVDVTVDKDAGWFGSDITRYKKAPAQAFGNIMDPKPGGHVVRVAEAGSPEIIAPAKRGADGKLGLEVSGAMLDNSKLLQSLVKINEGQASMIAGLNSQMSSMNSNFEKLVSEQRQANRLAV